MPAATTPSSTLTNILSSDQWQRALPAIRSAFPRLTEADLHDTHERLDLLIAKVQNRHWIDRVSARAQVQAVVQQALA